MVRSILLRGFDQDVAERIKTFMKDAGTKFIDKHVPVSAEKLESGKIKVGYQASDKSGEVKYEEFDTVFVATGRYPDTPGLGLKNLNVELDKGGKIVTDSSEKTNIDNIYAIGDCQSGRMELTPPAILSGKLLAKRLFGGAT